MPPSGIRRFFDMLNEMKDVISLTIGEPDFTTPEPITRAAIASLEAGETHYSANGGMLELRQLIASDLEARLGLSYDPRTEIVVTVGASEALDASLRAVCQPGDEVIHHEPCFVAYAPCIELAGGTPVAIATTAATDFELTPAMVEARRHRPHQGHLPGLSEQPHRRRPASRRAGGDRRGCAPQRPAGHQRRDLRAPGLRRPRARGHRLAAGHARANDPHRRLQQELRDDRLAHRLRVRAGGADGRDRQGPPVRDHVRADRRPVRRPSRRCAAASRSCRPCTRSTSVAGC